MVCCRDCSLKPGGLNAECRRFLLRGDLYRYVEESEYRGAQKASTPPPKQLRRTEKLHVLPEDWGGIEEHEESAVITDDLDH